VPSVGGGIDPSVEAIVALRPDLVLAWENDKRRDVPNKLAALGVPVFTLRTEDTTDVFRNVANLGRLTARDSAAAALAARLRGELDAVRRSVAGRPRPSVFYVVFNDPPMTAGPEDVHRPAHRHRRRAPDLRRRAAAVAHGGHGGDRPPPPGPGGPPGGRVPVERGRGAPRARGVARRAGGARRPRGDGARRPAEPARAEHRRRRPGAADGAPPGARRRRRARRRAAAAPPAAPGGS
jgi:hypothetical protein